MAENRLASLIVVRKREKERERERRGDKARGTGVALPASEMSQAVRFTLSSSFFFS